MRNISPKEAAELDAVETREWLESLDYVLQSGGPGKVARLLRELTVHARQNGVRLPFTANTPYINTIPADEQSLMPGSPDLERRIKSLVRWNAAAMVVRANKAEEGIGGHISTFASAATLYEVGFNHFFRGHDGGDGDGIFLPGPHAAGAREAGQSDLRHQLQPAAAGRAGARQRPDHPGARGGVPRRRLERDQGDLGPRVGSAAREGPRRPARAAHGRDRRRAVSEV